MILKSFQVNQRDEDIDITTFSDEGRRLMPGLHRVEADFCFILGEHDTHEMRRDLAALLGEDVVLVRRRDRTPEQRAKKICAYCGGNPGTGRTCEGCCAPNWE